MQEELQQLDSKAWILHYQKLHYEGEWTAIPLRSVGGRPDHIMIAPTGEQPYEDTIFLEECPYIKNILETFKCP